MKPTAALLEKPPSGPGNADAAPGVWIQPVDEVLRALGSSSDGLAGIEARRRLVRVGPNTLSTAEPRARWRILLEQFTSPLIYVLLAACAVTLAVGLYSDALIIALVLLVNATMGFVQEDRAERAMHALLGVVATRASVRRDGLRRDIPSTELVPGDVVEIEAGDLVPADMRLMQSSRLRTDESMLTGESAPTSKVTGPLAGERRPVAERSNMAFSGTAVVGGHGLGIVVATGGITELGRIAGEIRDVRRDRAPIQLRMRRLGRGLTAVILVACTGVFIAGVLQRREPFEMFLIAIATAVSVIPEGLPVVMTVALSVGVRRMARRNAIVRRLAAVETLGSCTVILTDKTGTLTENCITVERLWTNGRYLDLGEVGGSSAGTLVKRLSRTGDAVGMAGRSALVAGALANEGSIRIVDETGGVAELAGDPVDRALLVAAWNAGIDREELGSELDLVAELPFDAERRFSGAVYRDRAGVLHSFAKGAPERIVEMCSGERTDPVTPPSDGGDVDAKAGEAARCNSNAARGHSAALEAEAIFDAAGAMARDGMRVLGLAEGEGAETAAALLDGRPDGLRFLGLVGMLDPARPEAASAVRSCREAGIRVAMVTGDHVGTAGALARAVGIDDGDGPVLSGGELDRIGPEELAALLSRYSVFARMSPPQKLRLVDAFKQRGEIVAVTGDGINDAPALKSAHIGAAMGRGGTDVAREAADIVLTDDNFATIVAAIAEGRTAFANIRGATYFLVASGFGELVLIFSAVVAGLPLPLLPAQILWLNVVTNGIQDVALAFEPGEPETLRRPPRPPTEGVLSRRLIERSALVGLTLAATAMTVFLVELGRGGTLAYAQVAALTMLVVAEFVQLGSARSETRSIFRKSVTSNPALIVGALLAIAVHMTAMHWAPTRVLLGLEPLSLATWTLILPLGLSVAAVAEVHKWMRADRGTGS